MGSPLGLPIASFQLFSDSPEEVGRLDPEAKIKAEVKKSNLPSCLHPKMLPPMSFLIADLIFLVKLSMYPTAMKSHA